VRIQFSVEWPSGLPDGAYPGTNQCLAALTRPGEVVTVQPFTLSVPPGTFEADPGPIDPSSIAGTSPVVRCEPFEGDEAMIAMVN
jgi:hypothetical protein